MASMDVPADRPVTSRAARATIVKPTYITWLTLAFMTTASVASLRSAPTMAVYGLACVFLYGVAAIVFLLPTALVSAELASGWTGGVFRWVSEGITPRWGLLAVWCQFAMTIFYYPTLLGFVASTLAYVFNPDLADNGVYTGVVILIVFWSGVFLSARGGAGGIAKLASSGLLIGTLIPGALLVILGIVYLAQGNASAAPMDASHLLPEWTGIASLVLIVNNFLSYSGMEMNAVHVGSLRNPRGEFPKAMFLACGLVLTIFILPALAISWVIPSQELSLTAGVMQAFDAFFAYFVLQKLVPIVAIALVCASVGGMLTWLAGPSKGLLLIARREGYLPPFFQHQNENEVAVNILVVQGAVTTVIALLYALVPSVSSAYWILSVMTTQVYLVMYLLMFVAAVNLRTRQPQVERGYNAPALKFICTVGFVASAAAILIGFVPPSQFENGNTAAYVGLILAGTVLLGLLPPWLFLKFRKPSWKVAEEAEQPAVEPVAEQPPVEPGAEPASPQPVAAAAQQPPGAAAAEPAPSGGGGHRWLWWVLGGVVVILVVIGLATYSAKNKNAEAEKKAQQLTQLFQQAGLRVPQDQDIIVKSLGTDGGNVCDNPASALGKATLVDTLYNGADFVGRRPVIVPRRILRGEGFILQVYCPEKLQAYQDKVNDLKTDNTIKP
jgi:putative glutamate/gamma-aminobutyrate antiporter